MDTQFARKGDNEWSSHSVLVRLFTRTTYIGISTFLAALLPFFGDFIALVGALAAFPLEWGLIHHMYLKVTHLPCFSCCVVPLRRYMNLPQLAQICYVYSSCRLQVKGKDFGKGRLAWHWSMVVIGFLLTIATSIAGMRYIILDGVNYHAFADL